MEGTTSNKKPTSYDGSGLGVINFLQKFFYTIAVLSIILLFICIFNMRNSFYYENDLIATFTFLCVGVISLISGLLMKSVKTIVKAAHIYVTEHEVK